MKGPSLCLGERRAPAGRPLAARRRERRRWRRWLWLAPLIAVAAGGLLWGVRWALTADRFAVARVESGPYRFSAPGDLERRLAAGLGCNIWTRAGERRLREALLASPWVRRVDVQRELPGTLRVAIEEWRPLMLVQPDSAAAAVGARGTLALCADGRVVPLPAQLPAPDLPLLVGAELTPAANGGEQAGWWRLEEGLAGRVIALAAAFAETDLEAVSSVDFVTVGRDGLTVILQDGRARLRLGEGGYASSLRRYLAVRGELADGATVDLRFARRVFVGAAAPHDSSGVQGGALTGAKAGVAGRRGGARA
jgi:hypothetical protein